MPLNTPAQVSAATLLESYADLSFYRICTFTEGKIKLVGILEQILEKKDDFEAALAQTPLWLLVLETKHDRHFLCDSDKTERLITAIFLEALDCAMPNDLISLTDNLLTLKKGLSIRLSLYFEYKLHEKVRSTYFADIYQDVLSDLESKMDLLQNLPFKKVISKSNFFLEIRRYESEVPTIFFEMLIDLLNYTRKENLYPCKLNYLLENEGQKSLIKIFHHTSDPDQMIFINHVMNDRDYKDGSYGIYHLLVEIKTRLTTATNSGDESDEPAYGKHTPASTISLLMDNLKNPKEKLHALLPVMDCYTRMHVLYNPTFKIAHSCLAKHLTKEMILALLKSKILIVNIMHMTERTIINKTFPVQEIPVWKAGLFKLVETLISISAEKSQMTQADKLELHYACIDLINLSNVLRCEKDSIHNHTLNHKLNIARYVAYQSDAVVRSQIIQKYLPDVTFERADDAIADYENWKVNKNNPLAASTEIVISDDGTITLTDKIILRVENTNGRQFGYRVTLRSINQHDALFAKAYSQSEDIISFLFSDRFPLNNVDDFDTQLERMHSSDSDSLFIEAHQTLLRLSVGYQNNLLPLRLVGVLYLKNKRDKLLAKEAKLESLTDRLLHYKATFGELSESPRKNLLQYERMDRSFIFSSDHLKSHGLVLTEIILKNDLTTVTFSLRLKSLADSNEKSDEISSALLSAITKITDHEKVLQCSFDNNIVHIKVDPELRIGFLDESFSGLIKINDVLSEPLTDADHLALSTLQDNDTRISGFDESHIRSILMTYFERADLWEKTRLEYPVTLTEVLAALKNEYEAGKPTKKHLRYDIRLIRGEYQTHATCLIIDHEKKSIHYFDSLADNNDTLSAHDLPSSFDDYSLTFNNTKTQEDDFGCFAQVAHHIICTLHPDEALSPAERQERAQLGTDSVKLMNHYWRYVKLHQTMALDNKRAYTYLLNGLRQVYGQVKADAGLIIEEDSSESSALKLQQSGYLRAQLYSLILGIQNELADSASLATSIPLVFLAVFIRDNPDNLLARYIHLALRNKKSPLNELMLAVSLSKQSVLQFNADALIEVINKLIAKMNKVKVGLIYHEISNWRNNLQIAFQTMGTHAHNIKLDNTLNLDLVQNYDLLTIPGTLPAIPRITAKFKLRYIALIKQAYTANVPMFGECFGHQTLYTALTNTSSVTIESENPEQASTHLNPSNPYGNVHEITYDESSYFMHYQDFQSPTTTTSREPQSHNYLTDSSHAFCIAKNISGTKQDLVHIDASVDGVPEAFTSTATVGNTSHALVLGTQFHPSNTQAIINTQLQGTQKSTHSTLTEKSIEFHQWIILERIETAKFCRFFKKKEKSMSKTHELMKQRPQNTQ